MRPFNLAEVKIAERRWCKDHLDRQLRIIVVMVLIAMLMAVGSSMCKVMVRTKTQRVQSALADVRSRCIQIRREMTVVDAKLTEHKWQRQLARTSERWLNLLDSILTSVPDDIWIDRLENSTTDSAVMIDGSAASFESLSSFAEKLRDRREFSDVRLSSSRTGTSSGVGFVDFSLDLKLKTPSAGASTSQPINAPGHVPMVKESP